MKARSGHVDTNVDAARVDACATKSKALRLGGASFSLQRRLQPTTRFFWGAG
jgi:hypothetical protein